MTLPERLRSHAQNCEMVEPVKGDQRRHRLRCIGNGVELGTGLTVARSIAASLGMSPLTDTPGMSVTANVPGEGAVVPNSRR